MKDTAQSFSISEDCYSFCSIVAFFNIVPAFDELLRSLLITGNFYELDK